MRRRSHGEGSIRQRGKDSFSLRYRINGRRHEKAFRGSLGEARKELRRLLRAGDTGEHVSPNRITLRQWSAQWLKLLTRETGKTPRRRSRGLVSIRTRERHAEVLDAYVLPTLSERPLQQLDVSEFDNLYMSLEARLSPTTVRATHVCLRACLSAAVRKKKLHRNPSDDADVPSPNDDDVGQALDQDELQRLLGGFRGSVLYPMVAAAAFTGARLGEL